VSLVGMSGEFSAGACVHWTRDDIDI